MVVSYSLLIIFSLILFSGYFSMTKRNQVTNSDMFMIVMCLVFIIGSAQYIWG